MSFTANQNQLLSASSYACSIVKSALASDKLSDRERSILEDRQQKILNSIAVISTIVSSGPMDHAEADAIFAAVHAFGAAMFDIGMITHTTEAVQKHSAELSTKPARAAAAGKIEKRDAVIAEVLGPLIDGGLKGGKLHRELLRIFAERGIVGRAATPGPGIVFKWVREYKLGQRWKLDVQS